MVGPAGEDKVAVGQSLGPGGGPRTSPLELELTCGCGGCLSGWGCSWVLPAARRGGNGESATLSPFPHGTVESVSGPDLSSRAFHSCPAGTRASLGLTLP